MLQLVTVKELIKILSLMDEDMPVKLEDEKRNIKELKGIRKEDTQEEYQVVLSVFSNHE
jgi:hypothetical protein